MDADPGPTAGALGLGLDAGSALPVFEQVQTQVADLITAGTLAPGARLPAVRALAAALGVAPGTVAKAYTLLEQEGFVVGAGRRGTLVADQHLAASTRTRERLRAAVQPLLDQGMSSAEVLRLVRSVLEG